MSVQSFVAIFLFRAKEKMPGRKKINGRVWDKLREDGIKSIARGIN